MTEITGNTGPGLNWLKKIDRVWLLIVAGIAIGAVLNMTQTIASLTFLGEAAVSVAPFLILAIGIAAWTKATGVDSLIAKVFQGHQYQMIIAAALFGALSPFCSCGVIPFIAALLAMGVPIAPVMAFWLASPLMDPQSFLLVSSAIGFEFAVVKTISAVFFGLFGGFATHLVVQLGWFGDPLSGEAGGGCGAPNVTQSKIQLRFWEDPDRRRAFGSEFLKTTLFLGKWLTLAFLLESLMVAYVPGEAIAAILGDGQAAAIPLATLVGVPAYLNGFAAIPLIAGLIELGMSPAAGLAFMTAGGVTSFPAAIAVLALVRKPVFFWYIGLALLGSVMVGFAYQIYLI
jgi:uncharacterized membrane protein YraQ (UPF0718 family)